MKTAYGFAAALVGAFALAAAADDKPENKLPPAVVAALEKADELEVYSLDGEQPAKDGWHGFKVLGKTSAKGAEGHKVGALVAKGVAEGKNGAKCFIPRHGVRVTHEKKTYDLVICFECHWAYVYTDGGDAATQFTTSDAAEKALNAALTAAKVPLAKPQK